ncbi:hypothetical protein [Paraburkholderia sp.]|uniref:hypothetical protein n=1 Tax=Paraburkholderia sp. TaxID=1926495 RepID=UPI0023830685|nr:hypothetical protein [Paraburkholderia sp.]MDE1182676.1 hypothetical protein [Paraburkholderia sp.]
MDSTLTIKDLPVNETLDSRTMSAVHGGNAFAGVGGNYGAVFGGGGFASPTIGIQIGPIVNTIDASPHLNINVPVIQNFGGTQMVPLQLNPV